MENYLKDKLKRYFVKIIYCCLNNYDDLWIFFFYFVSKMGLWWEISLYMSY